MSYDLFCDCCDPFTDDFDLLQQMTMGELVQQETQLEYLSAEQRSERVQSIAGLVCSAALVILGLITLFTPFCLGGILITVLSGTGFFLSLKKLGEIDHLLHFYSNALVDVRSEMNRKKSLGFVY